MTEKKNIMERFAGKGVYPHQLAWVLLLPFRNLYLSPKKLIRRLELKDDFRVLELGPGPGYFSPRVARAIPKGKLYLADIQAEMLEKAARRLRKRKAVNFETVRLDGTSLPFANDFFDVIYLVTVLGEISEQETYAREMHRILKPGGIVSISEQAGDPDSLPLEGVQKLLEPAGFALDKVFGKGRTYTANFRKAEVDGDERLSDTGLYLK